MSEDKMDPPIPPKVQEESARAVEQFMLSLRELVAQGVQPKPNPIYANSIHFENGDLDQKILFGQVDHFSGKGAPVDWRTAVTMPWALTKLLSYYLRINLLIHESQNGKIKVPKSMFPQTPVAPTDIDTNPKSKAIFEFVQALHSELVAERTELESNP